MNRIVAGLYGDASLAKRNTATNPSQKNTAKSDDRLNPIPP